MEPEHSPFSRRAFLTTAGGITLGLGIGRVADEAHAAEGLPPLPWGPAYYPKAGLNGAAVRESGYCLYYKEGGCAHASFQSLVDALGVGLAAENAAVNPWLVLPRGMFKYAGAGILGWGTICGTLNASLALMDILGVHGALGNALVDYFARTALPTRALVGYVPPDGVPAPLATMVSSVSNSPLCHDSMTIWAATANVPVSHPSAKDRDAKLVGDIVFRAVELMNNHFLSGIIPAAWTAPESYADCYTCHTQPTVIPSVTGRIDCHTCHDVMPRHPRPGSGYGGGH